MTVLEQVCPLGQIVGKLLEDHEHYDAFASVLLAKMTGFSQSLKKKSELQPQPEPEQPGWTDLLVPKVMLLGQNARRS